MRMAVTVDDLPGDQHLPPGMTGFEVTTAVLKVLKDNRVPEVYGFANGGAAANNSELLNTLGIWLAEGYPLGNHTYSHANLDLISAADYIADIAKMQTLLDNLAAGRRQIDSGRLFRYPYLAEGPTAAKRELVRRYLLNNGYQIAQVTIDYNDWAWNEAYVRCLARHDRNSIAWLTKQVAEHSQRAARWARRISKLLFKRDIAQILLVHDTPFAAVTLGAVLTDFRRQGVALISLDEARKDPAYRIDPNYMYSGGLSFLAQVAASRNVDIDFVDTSIVRDLGAMCK